ncbi:unnamed protein product [Camellia sinensis]
MRRLNARKLDRNSNIEETNNSESESKSKMESIKLQFRPNSPHRSSLFSRNPKHSTTNITKFFASIAITLALFCYIFVVSTAFRNSGKRKFGIVIDGGSTGTRIHVFEYVVKVGVANFDFGENGLASMRVNRGLSAYAEDTEGAGVSLGELVEFGKKRVPKEYWGETEIRLMATAGLRMLELSVQDRILESCRKFLRLSGFRFRDDWASVITVYLQLLCLAYNSFPSPVMSGTRFKCLPMLKGSDEGVYAWVVANYALGTLGGDPLKTTGIIELGGASAQVTFVSREPIPTEFSRMVKFGNISYNLYSHSLLQFGQNVAFDLLRESLVTRAPESVNAEATVRRQAYTPVVLKSPRLEIAPITQGAPERMLLAVPKVESTKSWKDALLSPATQGAPERKLLAVPKVTGVTKKVTLLQKAESLRKITEDYVKASKQYAIVRATARTKSFLIQAKEANQFATTTFVAASTGATKNVVAQLLKRVEDSIKMVEFAQKKASVENMAIIRAIGRRVMTQTSVDEKKAPVVEKTVDAYKPIVLFKAQNRSNQISVNSQEPKEHPLAQQGSNKEHPLAQQNKKHPLAQQNKKHPLAQRDLNQHQLTHSKNVGTVLKIHEEFAKAQTVPSMPLGAQLDMPFGPVSKRQRRRRNKALKKLELRTVATNVIGAIERALLKDEPQKQIESPIFVGKSKVDEVV